MEMLSVVARLGAGTGARVAAAVWEDWDGVTVVVRGVWAGGVGFAVLLWETWGRVELELIARLVMGLGRVWVVIRTQGA